MESPRKQGMAIHPVRWMNHQIKRAKRLVGFVTDEFENRGGVKNTIHKVVSICRLEGIAGLKRGLVSMQYNFMGSARSGAPYVEGGGAVENSTDYADRHGSLENISTKQSRRLKSREEKALTGLDIEGLGLEIGPSYNPIAPKRKGFNVHTLDHLNTADLIKKYQSHPGMNLGKIEVVDYVWNGEPLSELIGKTCCYDYIIASHVIEHTPDLVSFLQQCEALLKPRESLHKSSILSVMR